jgi:hypothetical protein
MTDRLDDEVSSPRTLRLKDRDLGLSCKGTTRPRGQRMGRQKLLHGPDGMPNTTLVWLLRS